jgi:hypothetical protein
MLAAGSSMNALGCSLREMGSRPARRMDAPEPVMEHPEGRTCVHERAMEHPAPLRGHPERRSSHPAALMEHPERNGAAVWRLRTALLPRNTVRGAENGIRGRDRRVVGVKRSFIADIGWNGRDKSTDPARCGSPTFRTVFGHPRSHRRTSPASRPSPMPAAPAHAHQEWFPRLRCG